MNKINFSSLLLGIVFVIVSLVVFANPTATLISFVYIFVAGLLLQGATSIYAGFKTKKVINYIVGTVTILIAIYLSTNSASLAVILPWLFAVWFLIDSVGNLFQIGVYKEVHKGLYTSLLITNILNVILAILLVANPLSAVLTSVYIVGIYFLITGIKYIVLTFVK